MLAISVLGFCRRLFLITNVATVVAFVQRASHPEGQASLTAQRPVFLRVGGESSLQQIADPGTTHLLQEDSGQNQATESIFAQIDSRGAIDMSEEQQELEEVHKKSSPSSHNHATEGAHASKKSRKRSVLPGDSNTIETGVLPLWAQLLCGTLTTGLIMSIFFCIKGRLDEMVPRGVDSERLHIVLQETIERVDALKAQLDAQYQEQSPIAAPGEDPDVAAARALAQGARDRTETRAREIREAANDVAEQKEQLIAGAERVQDTFKDVVEGGRERLEGFSKLEATGLYAKVQEAVTEGNVPAWEAPEWMAPNEDEDFVTLPPLMHLVQGAVATRSIHSVKYSCHWKSFVDFVLIGFSVAVFILEWNKICKDGEVWVFQIGILSLATVDLLIRSIIIWWCGTALDALSEHRDEIDKANSMSTGNSLFDSVAILKRGSDSYFTSYFKYQRIVGSWTYEFLQFLTLFSLCWGGYGAYITSHDIVIDSLACEAKYAVKYMHCYSFFFVMLLTWNLLSLLLALVGCLSNSRLVSSPILKFAKAFDDDTMKGIPVALTFVESLVLPNSAGTLSMSQREVKEDLRRLTYELEELDRKLIVKRRTAERLGEVAAVVKTQEEYMERYQDMMDLSFKQAKPIVGLLAANVRTEEGRQADQGDPTASTTTADIRMAVNARRQRRGLRRALTAQAEESEENPEELNAEDVDSF